MSNPFLALGEDSDDEAPVKTAAAGPVKPATQVNNRKPTSSAAHQPKREELKKQEEDLKQKKKDGPGLRGGQHGAADAGAKAKPDSKPALAPRHGGEPSKHVTDAKPKEHDGRDRHLGAVPRKDQAKKHGGGSHNWGKPEDLVKEDAEALKPAASPAPEDGAAAAATPAEPEPVEEPQLTLEEYETLQAAKRVGPAFAEKQARQVKAEVVGTVYRKDANEGEGDYFPATKAKAKPVEKAEAAKVEAKKQTLQVDYKIRDTSAPPPRVGRGFGSGDRSGGAPRDDYRPPSNRGGRGRGAGPDRGAGPSRPVGGAARGAINTDDSAAFPKLGAA